MSPSISTLKATSAVIETQSKGKADILDKSGSFFLSQKYFKSNYVSSDSSLVHVTELQLVTSKTSCVQSSSPLLILREAETYYVIKQKLISAEVIY